MSEKIAKRDPRNQLAAGFYLGLISFIGWLSLINTPALWTNEFGVDPGPELLPVIVLTLLSGGALTLLGAGTFQVIMYKTPKTNYWTKLYQNTLLPTLFVISLIFYIGLMEIFGFIFASIIFALSWMWLLGLKSRSETAVSGLFLAGLGTLIGGGLIYFVFVYLIGVPIG